MAKKNETNEVPVFGTYISRLRKFDKLCDVAEVAPQQAVNLRSAYLNSCVPANVAADDVSFNGIEDPSKILDRPRDAFDAMSQQAAINEMQAMQEAESS